MITIEMLDDDGNVTEECVATEGRGLCEGHGDYESDAGCDPVETLGLNWESGDDISGRMAYFVCYDCLKTDGYARIKAEFESK